VNANGFIEYNPNGGGTGIHTLSDGEFGSPYGYTWVNDPANPCVHPGGHVDQWYCKMKIFDSGNNYVEGSTWIMVR
jgi:hypothetical protein